MSARVAVPPEVRALLAAVRELDERNAPTTISRLQVATGVRYQRLADALVWLRRRGLASAPVGECVRRRGDRTFRAPLIRWHQLEVNWAQADRLLAGGAS